MDIEVYASSVTVRTARDVPWSDLENAAGETDELSASCNTTANKPDELLATFPGLEEIPPGATITQVVCYCRVANLLGDRGGVITTLRNADDTANVSADVSFLQLLMTSDIHDISVSFLGVSASALIAGVALWLDWQAGTRDWLLESVRLRVVYTPPPPATHDKIVSRPAARSPSRSAARKPTAI